MVTFVYWLSQSLVVECHDVLSMLGSYTHVIPLTFQTIFLIIFQACTWFIEIVFIKTCESVYLPIFIFLYTRSCEQKW